MPEPRVHAVGSYDQLLFVHTTYGCSTGAQRRCNGCTKTLRRTYCSEAKYLCKPNESLLDF